MAARLAALASKARSAAEPLVRTAGKEVASRYESMMAANQQVRRAARPRLASNKQAWVRHCSSGWCELRAVTCPRWRELCWLDQRSSSVQRGCLRPASSPCTRLSHVSHCTPRPPLPARPQYVVKDKAAADKLLRQYVFTQLAK